MSFTKFPEAGCWSTEVEGSFCVFFAVDVTQTTHTCDQYCDRIVHTIGQREAIPSAHLNDDARKFHAAVAYELLRKYMQKYCTSYTSSTHPPRIATGNLAWVFEEIP